MEAFDQLGSLASWIDLPNILVSMRPFWAQRTFTLDAKGRGCHLITEDIIRALPELRQVRVGLLHLFCHHTSCSLTINENCDPDVRKDMEDSLSRLVPENVGYRHTDEGIDDMPAHMKCSLLGVSSTIPITNGALNLGTWQGIYLCEHRNGGRRRDIVATIHGSTDAS